MDLMGQIPTQLMNEDSVGSIFTPALWNTIDEE